MVNIHDYKKKKQSILNQHISINEAGANEMLMTVTSVAAIVRRIPECSAPVKASLDYHQP